MYFKKSYLLKTDLQNHVTYWGNYKYKFNHISLYTNYENKKLLKSFDIVATCLNNVYKDGEFREILFLSWIKKKTSVHPIKYYFFEKNCHKRMVQLTSFCVYNSVNTFVS
jgi:hypothetical protein